MPTLPWTKWYADHWLRDTRILSVEAKSLWIDAINYMLVRGEGQIEASIKEWARMTGMSDEQVMCAFSEICTYKIADVHGDLNDCNARVTLVSRRLTKELKVRENTRERVQKHREKSAHQPCATPPKRDCNACVTGEKTEDRVHSTTPLTPHGGKSVSDSSQSDAPVATDISLELTEESAPKKQRGPRQKAKWRKSELAAEVYEDWPNFCKWWASYPNRTGKRRAFEAWIVGGCEFLNGQMGRALAVQKESDAWQKDGGKFIPHGSTYLNARRWEDIDPDDTPAAEAPGTRFQFEQPATQTEPAK